MSWPHDAGRWSRHALAAAAATVLGGIAYAQDAVLEVVVDGRPAAVGRFLIRDGIAHATLAAWRSWGLRVPLAVADVPGTLVAATALPGVTSHVDAATQTLRISRRPDLSNLTLLGREPATGESTPPDFGALLNYDAVLQRAAAQTRGNALLDMRLFGPLGLFEHGLIVSDTAGAKRLRLNTSFTQVDPQRMQRWRAGDFVAGGLTWTRPVRLAGLQAMKDFGLRPDLVTTPTPDLGGTVAVPSTVEVLVNGVHQLSQAVDPGRFELRQLPIVSGAGQVAVVVRDALGRETVRSLPFYAAAQQLAPGLAQYSLQAGWVRRRFGIASEDYGPFAASASLRGGWSRELTLEGHAEATAGTAMAGGAALLALPQLGLLSASLATSRGAGRQGASWGLGAERRSDQGHAAFALTRSSGGFRDIAAALGEASPPRSLRLSAGTNFDRLGSIGLAWFDLAAISPAAARQRIATGSWSVSLGTSVQAFVSAYRSLGEDSTHGVSVTLTLPFGLRSSGSTGVTVDRAGSSLALQVQQQAVEVGEVGWRMQSERRFDGDTLARQQASVEYRAPAAWLGATAESAAGASALRLSARGALVYAAGSMHAVPPVGDSMAVVDLPGLPGVAVYRENRLVGRTDGRGQLLIPDLLPYQANRVAIEALDLPLDAEFGNLTQDVRPQERSGLLVRFDIRRVAAVLVRLEDAQGQPLPLGAVASMDGGITRYPVGHDGQVYLRNLAVSNSLVVTWGARQSCTAQVRPAELDARNGRLGPLPCH
ncbi:MAG: fimbria/pilus outer membrane usher protein [Pseudomonadota bacterium]